MFLENMSSLDHRVIFGIVDDANFLHKSLSSNTLLSVTPDDGRLNIVLTSNKSSFKFTKALILVDRAMYLLSIVLRACRTKPPEAPILRTL